MMALEPYHNAIADMARKGLSSTDISANLIQGHERGFTARNVRKYCTENGISLKLPSARLELEVAQAITEVGESYCVLLQLLFMVIF